jgi:O-antigen ligase/Flp pilus assembly protein TadD
MIYDRLIESLLAFLFVFTPLAFGAVHPWSIAIFEVAAALMGLFWVLKMLSRSKPEFIGSPIFALFLILIGCASLQFFFSHYPLSAIRYTLPRSIYPWATKTELLKLVTYALIFLVTLNTIRTRRQIIRVLSAIITVGFLMSIFYLMRYFGAPAPTGFINSDHFSTYLGMIIPLSLGFLFVPSPTSDILHTIYYRRILLFFFALIMSAALFFTMSRGGMFSFIAALLFIALLVSTRRSMKNKSWLILAITVFIILIIAWLGATPVVERILSFKAEIASRYYGGRLPIWQGTIGIIKDNPIFGTGLGTFNYIFPKYQPAVIVAKHYTYAHSDFLELLSEVGIVGFVLFMVCGLWSMVYLFRRYRERHDPWVVGISLCIFGSLTAIFIHSFTDFNLHIPANAILLVSILALFISILNMDREIAQMAISVEKLKYPIGIVAVALIGAFITAAVRPAIADYFASSQRNFGLAIRLDPANATYHYQLGKATQAIDEYMKAAALNPTNSQYHQSLAWAYGKTKNISEAQQEFKTAIELSPTYYYPYQVYAIWLFNHPTKENIEKGVQVYRKASALNPKLADKALAEYFKIEKSYARLKKVLPDTPENHSKVMAMLLDAGLWETNEAEFKKDMEAATYKYPYYNAISLYYEKRGDRIKSIEILSDYLKLDPNCADAHFYIADRLAYTKPVNWQEVFSHHERALALAPENTFYREWYARHLFYAKRYNDAIVELEKVVAKDGWNVDLLRLLGDWYKSVGRTKDADVMYTEASRVSEHLKSEKK